MQCVDSTVEFITDIETLDPRVIVDAGRTCYKSNKLDYTDTEVDSFIRKLISSGHESPLEHLSFTVRFITDRGISHELVRHRLAAFSQESTRYANYSKDKFGNQITCIMPRQLWDDVPTLAENVETVTEAYKAAERAYMDLLARGVKPQIARSVLPNGLKTELVMTCNIREWRHILKLRCDEAAHPEIRYLCKQIYDELKKYHPYFVCDMDFSSSDKEV